MKSISLFIFSFLFLCALVINLACYQQPPYKKASGERVNLINCKTATDPMWEDLKAFLAQDITDRIKHDEVYFNCADGAEMLHNNAEKYNIRAAFVAIGFENKNEPGHSLNAFDTRDKGLVFIDGGKASESQDNKTANPDTQDLAINNDTVAYIEIGAPYGTIDINYARQFDYDFFESYLATWYVYQEDLKKYNELVREYNSLNSQTDPAVLLPKESEIKEQKEWVEALKKDLGGTFYEPMGNVNFVDIYW